MAHGKNIQRPGPPAAQDARVPGGKDDHATLPKKHHNNVPATIATTKSTDHTSSSPSSRTSSNVTVLHNLVVLKPSSTATPTRKLQAVQGPHSPAPPPIAATLPQIVSPPAPPFSRSASKSASSLPPFSTARHPITTGRTRALSPSSTSISSSPSSSSAPIVVVVGSGGSIVERTSARLSGNSNSATTTTTGPASSITTMPVIGTTNTGFIESLASVITEVESFEASIQRHSSASGDALGPLISALAHTSKIVSEAESLTSEALGHSTTTHSHHTHPTASPHSDSTKRTSHKTPTPTPTKRTSHKTPTPTPTRSSHHTSPTTTVPTSSKTSTTLHTTIRSSSTSTPTTSTSPIPITTPAPVTVGGHNSVGSPPIKEGAAIGIGIGSGAFVVLLFLLGLFLWRRRKQGKSPFGPGTVKEKKDKKAYPEVAWLYDPMPSPNRDTFPSGGTNLPSARHTRTVSAESNIPPRHQRSVDMAANPVVTSPFAHPVPSLQPIPLVSPLDTPQLSTSYFRNSDNINPFAGSPRASMDEPHEPTPLSPPSSQHEWPSRSQDQRLGQGWI